MANGQNSTYLSFMLAVDYTPAAVEWYMKALDAVLLWSMGSVAGLEINGAPFFLHEPVEQKFKSPVMTGCTTSRIEMFVDDIEGIVSHAINAGAKGSIGDIRDYQVPWGIHRQGGFIDPFGHVWHVGDKSPLNRH